MAGILSNVYSTVLLGMNMPARVSVNFRKFSPCVARARRARAFDSLPSLSEVENLSFR